MFCLCLAQSSQQQHAEDAHQKYGDPVLIALFDVTLDMIMALHARVHIFHCVLRGILLPSLTAAWMERTEGISWCMQGNTHVFLLGWVTHFPFACQMSYLSALIKFIRGNGGQNKIYF